MNVSKCNELESIKPKDSLWVCLKQNDEKVIIGCVYRKGTSSMEMNVKLCETIKKAKELGNKVMIFGDFNFPEIDWPNHILNEGENGLQRNAAARMFVDTIDDAFLIQHVTEPTRVRGLDNPSCLDLIISECEMSVNSVKYLTPLGNSDHCVLTWNYVLEMEFSTDTLKRKCYYKGDYNKMRRLLRAVDWKRELVGLTLDEKYNQFREILLRIEEQCIPTADVN